MQQWHYYDSSPSTEEIPLKKCYCYYPSRCTGIFSEMSLLHYHKTTWHFSYDAEIYVETQLQCHILEIMIS